MTKKKEEYLQKIPIPPPQEEEEEGIDIIALCKKVWDGRKTVLISFGVCFVLGLFVALFTPKQYSVTSVMMPQLGASKGGSLSSLASLAGINLGSASATGELSPLMYPQIVSSVPFRLELLMDTPLSFSDYPKPITLYEYYTDSTRKKNPLGVVKKYTVGLPGLILGAIRGKKPEPDYSGEAGSGVPLPMTVTNKQYSLLKDVAQMVSLSVDQKQGYLTLNVTGPEPLATAQLAEKAQKLLQEEIIKFQVEKSQSELDYIQARYDEVRAETESLQAQVAKFTDRSQSLVNSYSQLYQTRVRNKYNISNSVYQTLATQLEQAKMQVKRDTPTFSIIQPVVVPSEKSAPSRPKILIIWMFLGVIIGAGIVLLKEQFLPEFIEKWKSSTEDSDAEA